MHCDLHSLILNLDLDIGFEPYTCWVICEVSCLALSISLIIWGDYSDLLSKVAETNGELIDHDTKASHS